MNRVAKTPDPESRPGTGALCPEAQADGVPCTERGRECETCEKAVAGKEPGPEVKVPNPSRSGRRAQEDHDHEQ